MNLRLDPKANHSLRIHNGTAHHLQGIKPGVTITCDQGIVWLTESDNRQDYMLRPGHSVTICRRGEVVIEALSDAAVTIISPN